MQTLIIALYTLKRNLKNLVVLVFFIAAPLCVVFLVGKSLEGSKSPATIAIGYHLAGGGHSVTALRELLQDRDTGSVALRFQEVNSLDLGMRLLNAGLLDELVDLSPGTRPAGAVTARVYSGRKSPAAYSLLNTYSDRLSEAAIAQGFGLAHAAPAAVMRERIATATGRAISGLDAWSSGGILIFLFYGSLIGSYALIQDRDKRTRLRIHSAPVRPWQDVAGKSLGNVSAITACGLISVLASKYLFSAQWCSLPVILAAVFLFAAVANGFGMLLAKFSNNMIVCAMIAFAVNFFFAVLTITPHYVPALRFSPFNLISPHFYTQQALVNSVCGGRAGLTAASLGALALMAAGLYALVLANRKERAS